MKDYEKHIRAVNVKTGKVQWLSPYIAENTLLLEKNGFKIDDPDYENWLKNKDKKVEVAKVEEVKEEATEAILELEVFEEVKEKKPRKKVTKNK